MSFKKKLRTDVWVLLSFGIYIFLNELFSHIGLLISERRLVAFPYLTGIVCGKLTGFDTKITALFVVFLLSRFTFFYVLQKSNLNKITGLDELAGVYVVTDFLLVWLSFLVPLVNWDVYFYTAWPILRVKKMFGYDSWICFFVVGTVCSIFYQYFFKKKLKDYINFMIISAISFALAFVLYYVFLGRIVYVE